MNFPRLILRIACVTLGASFSASLLAETDCQISRAVREGLALSAESYGQMRTRADKGELHAQMVVGIAGTRGTLSASHYSAGMQSLELAANNGSRFASKLLENEYSSIALVKAKEDEKPMLYAKAARWAKHGAELGDLDSQRSYGDFLAAGRGEAPDPKAAVVWWRRAAEQGSAFAQNSLSKALFEGRGTSQDNVEALKWGLLAAQKIKGPSFGRLQVMHLSDLRKTMSESEIALAEEQVRTWALDFQRRENARHDANERECGVREFDKGAVR